MDLWYDFGVIGKEKKFETLSKTFDSVKKTNDENVIFILLRTFNPEDLNIHFSKKLTLK